MLRNYTEKACDGDLLAIRCPPRTTITVQSAFYGRNGASDPQRCPQIYQALLNSYNAHEDDRHCSVSTALQVNTLKCRPPRPPPPLVYSFTISDLNPGEIISKRSKWASGLYSGEAPDYVMFSGELHPQRGSRLVPGAQSDFMCFLPLHPFLNGDAAGLDPLLVAPIQTRTNMYCSAFSGSRAAF